MSATGKPSSSSLPSRYSRVRAWHRVGVTWQMADAAAVSGSRPWKVCPGSGRAPSAFTGFSHAVFGDGSRHDPEADPLLVPVARGVLAVPPGQRHRILDGVL